MNKSNQLLYDGQSSFIKKKLNALYNLMFLVSNGTKLHYISNCFLVFLGDIQLIYFVFFNRNVLVMDENKRAMITLLALDYVPFNMFILFHYALSFLYILAAVILAYKILFVHSEKYKENLSIKYLRFCAILFNTVLFPIFTQIIFKAIIPKDQKLAAYPTIPYLTGDMLLVAISLLAFISYLFLQFIYYPFIYVNPTPFQKKNSMCQSYNFLGLKYNIAISLLTFVTQITKAYIPKLTNYIFIILLLFMINAFIELINNQPYYSKHINNLRAGTWMMIIGMCTMNLIGFLFVRGKSFFIIIVIIVGVISFIFGILFNHYYHNRHIKAIYRRFKSKKIEDKKVYNYLHGVENSVESSENEAKSLSSSEDENNEEKLISVDSATSSSNSNNNDNEKAEEEDDDDDSSSERSFAISDKISERITAFSSIREIMQADILNEPTIIYKCLNEFELACRFLWNNETREAFQLMKELYSESLKQYRNNPLLYTYYSYYLIYINLRLSKSDKDIVLELENNDNTSENENDKNEDEEEEEIINEDTLNANDPDYLLSKALSSKLNFLGKYFVRFIIYSIKEKRKEEKDYYKKEALEKLVALQHEAIEKHITILNTLKKFFNSIKYINSRDSIESFSMDNYLKTSFTLKKETLELYQKIISDYPDEKSTYQLYTLYMTDVMNEADNKYMLAEGDSFMALNAPNKNVEQKPKRRSSIGSYGVSIAEGSSFGDEMEFKKRTTLKSNMIHSFTDKSKRISKITITLFILTLILYIISTIYGFVHINSFNQGIKNISILEDMNYNVNNLLVRFRMLTTSTAMGDISNVVLNMPILLSYLDAIEDKYIPILENYSHKPKSSHPVVLYNINSINGNTKSELAHFNGYELMKNIVVWGRTLTSTPPEEWLERVNAGQDIILDYRIRMFAENFQYYYNDVIDETMNIMYEDEIASNNIQIYVIYIFTGCLIVLATSINIFGIAQLSSYSKSLYNKTIKLFKYLLKGSINDIISKFEISIESITETYDIASDNKKNKHSNKENKKSFKKNINKLKGVIINILLIGSILLLTVPIIVKDKLIISNLDYNLEVGKRKDMLIFMSIFSFEVILQDGRFYVPGSSEAYLNNEIKKLEKIQEKIYTGKLGLKPTPKLRYLDSLLLNQDCRFDDPDKCELIEEMLEIDYTKKMLKLSLNEFIDELCEKMKSILYSSNIKNFKTMDHMYKNIYDNTRLFLAFGNVDFYFELLAIEHLFAGLEKFDAILYENLYSSIKSTMAYLVFIIFVGIILISIAFIMIYSMIKSTNERLTELVNMIFIVPPSTINMIPQFKRFIETSSFEEE